MIDPNLAPATAPMIRFSRVNKNYGEYKALIDIDAEVETGATRCVPGVTFGELSP